MKRQLFGQLGEKIKGRGVARAMLACVALAGIFCYGTVKNINERLERQRQQNIARQQEKMNRKPLMKRWKRKTSKMMYLLKVSL